MSLPVGKKLTRKNKWMLFGLLLAFDVINGVVIGGFMNGLPYFEGALQ